ncbi:zinc finger protein 799-like [Topomyia yanbarensis]|uniref:zinc finger protein 799-like n=1 Tax=Topomyia yanbarensis TaxID=2498891 RepID=UPI00273C52AF|nr:zinc finger protein 799-like [Topomyia yanbarensis]
MPASCTVLDCELKYNHAVDVSYHKYPLNKPELLGQWIAFVGRGPEWLPTKWSAICSRHFKPSDFKDCVYRKNLISTAIPSVRIKHQTPIAELITEKVDETKQWESGLHRESHVEGPETETDPEDLSGGEETQLLDMTCRLCGIVFSKWCKGLLSDFHQHASLIAKCLQFINLDLVNFPTKVCAKCLKTLNGFSAFHDNVAKVQCDLERKYSTAYEHYSTNVPIVEPSRVLKIKQEPLMNIKEETIDSAAKSKEIPEITENTLIIKNPNITNDKNKILLFNKPSGDVQSTKQTRESKNCEILEIVNLYPPIVDITSATIREVQPYEITLPSSLSNFNPVAPQIVHLKTENTNEKEEDYEGYTGYFQDFLAGFATWEEHSYSKLPVQADDNKDEVFPSHELEPMESINLDESATVRVIHVELPSVSPPDLKYLCSLCNQYKFQSRKNLLRHRIVVCSSRKRSPYRCLYCQQKFSRWINRQTHLAVCHRRTFHRLRKCEKARLVLAGRLAQKLEMLPSSTADGTTSVHQQQQQRSDRHNCTLCDRSYSRLYNLKRHMGRHRPRDQWNHKCGVCQKIFDKLFDLKKHFQLSKCMGSGEEASVGYSAENLEECNGSDRMLQTSGGAPDRLLYVCSTCNKQFKSYNSLKVHESNHTGLKVFVCETCGKRFGGQVNLSQHRMTHVDVRQFGCKLCPKVFKRTGGLSQHVKAFHMKIKPYQCTVCRRDFALKADMTRCRHSKLKDFG